MTDKSSVKIKSLPIIIDTFSVPSIAGQIGISSCPGAKEFGTIDLYEDKLENDIQAIKNWGAIAVISLLDLRELAMLGAADIQRVVLESNMLWIQLPLREHKAPDSTFLERWTQVSPLLSGLLKEGQRVLIHCKEGVGRSGLVAAMMLVVSGVSVYEAERVVKKARPGALLLSSHEKFLESYAAGLTAIQSVMHVRHEPCFLNPVI